MKVYTIALLLGLITHEATGAEITRHHHKEQIDADSVSQMHS